VSSKDEFNQSPGVMPGLYSFRGLFLERLFRLRFNILSDKAAAAFISAPRLVLIEPITKGRGLYKSEGAMIWFAKTNTRPTTLLFRSATFMALLIAASACATTNSDRSEEFSAYGYLTPGPTSEPELIGLYPSMKECKAAGKAWMSQQVVGNPIFSECMPVDKN
jgi:hypothetical protein